jgi:hypothetical protein
MRKNGLFLRRDLGRFLIIPVITLLVSCATSAPSLPDDTTSSNKQRALSLSDFPANDSAMDCKAIQAEQTDNAAKIDQDNKAIESNRRQNEVAGYLGALVLLPLIATESNTEEKDDIAARQQRQDVLRKLAVVKECRS